jgi:DNA-directed RNA polymerase subunit RPC12/RpoP
VSNDEVTLGIPVPLDSAGFLRRACPTCEREFKRLPSTTEDPGAEKPSDDGYFCPYCGIQAPDGSWFTKEQLELAQNMVGTEVVGFLLKDFTRYDPPEKMHPLTEADDMQRVDF